MRSGQRWNAELMKLIETADLFQLFWSVNAVIIRTGKGNYALRDEGSANGTKVNGQLVSKYQTLPLAEGDRIQIGQTVFVFFKR